jgi:O-methyltransferase involved in polyketide biosynthesis
VAIDEIATRATKKVATGDNLTPTQRSIFATLYLRALDSRSQRPILGDTLSSEIVDKIDYDFSQQKARWSTGSRLVVSSLVANVALRSKRLDEIVGRFVARHPDAIVIELGCGLDPRAARCGPTHRVDWYDVDFPEVIALREQYLPRASRHIGADLGSPQWLDGIPSDRPAMIVADGLMAFLSDHALRSLARSLTAHFPMGEFAFNAYTRFLMRRGRNSSAFKALGSTPAGEGMDDPREPEGWGARLNLVEELLLTRAPEVARLPQPLRSITRLCALSPLVSRQGNWVVRYRFENQEMR